MNFRAQLHHPLHATNQSEVDHLETDRAVVEWLGAERGQTTAEYALVLLAAGSIAMLVVGWAQSNDAIGSLFDTVLSRITSLMA